jgi:hypothetical protein
MLQTKSLVSVAGSCEALALFRLAAYTTLCRAYAPPTPPALGAPFACLTGTKVPFLTLQRCLACHVVAHILTSHIHRLCLRYKSFFFFPLFFLVFGRTVLTSFTPRAYTVSVSAARASALPILRESLRISQELQDVIGQSNVLEAMGTEYVDAGDTAAAIQAWRQCIELRQVRTLLALLVLVLMCKY